MKYKDLKIGQVVRDPRPEYGGRLIEVIAVQVIQHGERRFHRHFEGGKLGPGALSIWGNQIEGISTTAVWCVNPNDDVLEA